MYPYIQIHTSLTSFQETFKERPKGDNGEDSAIDEDADTCDD
jgi:hypothetical protein